MDIVNEIDVNTLIKILQMQNSLEQLSEEAEIFEFVCHGLKDFPGVNKVWFHRGGKISDERGADGELAFSVHLLNAKFGCIFVQLSDEDAFSPYIAHIGSLCLVMAATLEKRAAVNVELEIQARVEETVVERTNSLSHELIQKDVELMRALDHKEQLQRYLDVTEAFVVELNHDGNIVVINSWGAQLLGWKQQDLIGKNWFDVAIPTDARLQVMDIFRAALNGEMDAIEHVTNEVLCKDGTRRLMLWHNVPRFDSSGRIINIVCAGVDTTYVPSTYDTTGIDGIKERMDVIFQALGDGIIVTDTYGVVQFVNDSAANYTGWSLDLALGKALDDVYQTAPLGISEMSAASKSSGSGPERRKMLSRNGIERVVSHLETMLNDPQGDAIGHVLTFRDITQEEHLRDRLEKNTRLDSIGVLAGSISHDFDNLLSAMFGFLELAGDSEDIGKVREYLRKIKDVYERARHLTTQLQTLSGGGKPVMKRGDIGPVVKEVASHLFVGANVGCTFNINDSLWQVAFDEHQLSKVIGNIVTNAKQAMYKDGNIIVSVQNVDLQPSSHLGLSSERYVRISVQDFGIGIPKQLLARIFDPFSTTKQEGSGVGLSTAHSIVHRHDGIIDVESQLGVGSTFHVYLPAVEQSMIESDPPPKVNHPERDCVLVLDDEEIMREISSAMLDALGYDTICFENGKQVIDHLKHYDGHEKRPVAALLDLTIPGGIGGAEIADAIRKNVDDLVIIAASGFSSGEVMINPKEYGFTDSLSKPFRKKDLSIVLHKHLCQRTDDLLSD